MILNLHPAAAQILVAADDSIKDGLGGPNDLLAQLLVATLPAHLWGAFVFIPNRPFYPKNSQKTAILARFMPFMAKFRYFLNYDIIHKSANFPITIWAKTINSPPKKLSSKGTISVPMFGSVS